MKIHDFQKYKSSGRKINFITCYDYSFAKIVEGTNIDCILVGDSLAMTMHGEEDTLCADIEMLSLHTRAVSRGINKKFIVADLPFMSYRGSLDLLNKSVLKLMQAGANAVKLEGVDGNEQYIRHLVDSGVPVMGHLGLTPQFINTLGGYRVQGKTKESAEILLDQAKRLEKAGCFCIVLECVPTDLAQKITEVLNIPTIGIGAGNKTDGQILVIQDMLGMNLDFTPKFVKKYLKGNTEIAKAINNYCQEVQDESFPCAKYSFESSNKVIANKQIEVIKEVESIQKFLSKISRGSNIGFVATMGNLHDGHASLIYESVKNNAFTVLSIFVNPVQFNNKKDLEKYPRTIDQDLELAKSLGVDCVFLPSVNDIYHEKFDFRMSCSSDFATKCEGQRRGHFDGVLTVVMKLLNIIKPTNAYFGEKDYQQYMLIKEMVRAFFLDTNIISCKTVRLESELAMSSRNNLLSEDQKGLAAEISKIIRSEKNNDAIKQKVKAFNKDVDVLYVEDLGGRRLYAFIINGVRLIDNYSL